jgi:pyridoxal phosphate enzyme (YggS family)
VAVNLQAYHHVKAILQSSHAQLVAVSKTKPAEDIMVLYREGQRLFGENYVQELAEKQKLLPADIQWHFIGHLQTNKVKYIASFISVIQTVDSLKLLKEIHQQASRHQRVISVLLQVRIAREATKSGLSEEELFALLNDKQLGEYTGVNIIGLMGMATNTADTGCISKEFTHLKALFDRVRQEYFASKDMFRELSMGMSADYPAALEAGATLVRIGSLLFGERS